jgi:hypothetical protein
MLGIEVSLATVVRYMPWRPTVPSPTWRSFLHNHMHNMARGSHEVVLVISQPSHAGLNPPGQEIGRLRVGSRFCRFFARESDQCKLQMTGSAAQHRKAIPQNPAGPKRAKSQPETMVNSAVAPPIPTVP